MSGKILDLECSSITTAAWKRNRADAIAIVDEGVAVDGCIGRIKVKKPAGPPIAGVRLARVRSIVFDNVISCRSVVAELDTEGRPGNGHRILV